MCWVTSVSVARVAGVAEENARHVGSCFGSVIQVVVEWMVQMKYENQPRAVEYESGGKSDYNSGKNVV
jgi:hypothetical protein